jgi:hypothetical protein
MGYTTRFKGTLLFANEITIPELAFLNELLDLMPHAPDGPPEYIGLRVNSQLTGLVDSGDEKIYGMHKTINWLTERMRRAYPGFRLTGQFICTGEDGEVWKIILDDTGVASELDIDLDADAKDAAKTKRWEVLWAELSKTELEARSGSTSASYETRMMKAFDATRKVLAE